MEPNATRTFSKSNIRHCRQIRPLPRSAYLWFAKRKVDDIFDRPSKIQVTEDMVASKLNGLHLSSNYTTHGFKPSLDTPAPSTSGENLFSTHSSSDTGLPKLTLCDELRTLKGPIDILPKVLEVQRPTTALMLWRPPAGYLGRTLQMHMDKHKMAVATAETIVESLAQEEATKVLDTQRPMPDHEPNRMDVELENNNTDMSCAYNDFSRAI